MRDLEQYAHYFFSSPDEEPRSIAPAPSEKYPACIVLVHSSLERYAAFDIVAAYADWLADGESRIVIVTSDIGRDPSPAFQGTLRQPRHAHVAVVTIPEWTILQRVRATASVNDDSPKGKADVIVVEANAFTPDCLDVLASIADCEIGVTSEDVPAVIEAYQFIKAYSFPKQGYAEYLIADTDSDGKARLVKESVESLFSVQGCARCPVVTVSLGELLKGACKGDNGRLGQLRSQVTQNAGPVKNAMKKIFTHIVEQAGQASEVQRR